jgi:two-component system, NarL family, nitrate/nitrite response regulator NarL
MEAPGHGWVNNVIGVAVVWDDPGLFETLRSYVAYAPDVEIRQASTAALLNRGRSGQCPPTTSGASRGSTMPPGAGTERPDVVLFEVIRRPGLDPIADVRSLCKAGYRVLALSRSADPYLSAALLGTGACLLLGKNQTPAAIVAAIRASGPRNGSSRPPGGDRPQLSERERSVLVAYTSGMTLDAVAERVGIRPSTAKTYLERVKAKYREAGRAAYTKLELAQRADEDHAHAEGP